MMKRILFLTAALSCLGGAAMADTFVWQDPTYGFSMSFPDSWALQTPDKPDTRLRIAGPVGEDLTTCRMQVHKDGRLQIYPKRLLDEAVMQTLDRGFWEQQTGEFVNAKITSYYAPAGMGDKGDATAIQVSFLQPEGDGKMAQMRGVMIASIYADDLYVASCSTRHELFDKYSAVFGSIFDSVMLESKYHIYPTGYYRNFLMDEKLSLPRSKPGTADEDAGNYFTRLINRIFYW